jgi:hypothetical protein
LIGLGTIEGAGLGLSIVQSICIAHGGVVKAENHANGGCLFTVKLPLAKQQNKLAMANLRRLPPGTLPPVVLKFDASSWG